MRLICMMAIILIFQLLAEGDKTEEKLRMSVVCPYFKLIKKDEKDPYDEDRQNLPAKLDYGVSMDVKRDICMEYCSIAILPRGITMKGSVYYLEVKDVLQVRKDRSKVTVGQGKDRIKLSPNNHVSIDQASKVRFDCRAKGGKKISIVDLSKSIELYNAFANSYCNLLEELGIE